VIRLELLGGFRVTADGTAIPDEAWHRRKMASLVKLLCLSPRYRLRRAQITETLWPDLPPAAAAANLRKTVHFVRHMADAGPVGVELIQSEGEHLSLPADKVWVDVVAFRSELARARAARDVRSYATVIDLYPDGLLPEDGDDWIDAYRSDLRDDYVAALTEYSAILESAGLLEDAARISRMLISVEPLAEEAHVRLIRVLAIAGRQAEALRQYEELRDLLAAELDIEPGPLAQQLYEEIRTRRLQVPSLNVVLWERVGDLRMSAGDALGAVTAYQSALELAATGEDAARLHRLVAAAHLGKQKVERAEPHLSRAEAMTSDRAERARLVCLRAEQAWMTGDLDASYRLAIRARELATAHGTAEDQARAEEAVAIVSHLRGDWRAGLEIELHRSGAGIDTKSSAGAFDIHQCISQFHLYSDELCRDVEQYARTTLSRAIDAGSVRVQAFAWCLLGESLLLHGHYAEAAGCLQRSAEQHAALESASGALPWQRLAELAVCQGDLEDIGPALRQASAIATVSPMARHVWQRIHATAALARLERGQPDLAARAIRAAAAATARYGGCPTCGALLNPIAAEVHATLGDAEAARDYAALAAEVAARFGGSAWRAMADSAAAHAALASGDTRSAHTHMVSAAERYESVGHVWWAQRCRGQAAERSDALHAGGLTPVGPPAGEPAPRLVQRGRAAEPPGTYPPAARTPA
jgi:DNA-binding SARP family transcriptional activator